MKASRRSWKNANPFGVTGDMKRILCICVIAFVSFSPAFAQTKSGSHSSRKPASMSAETKALVEEAIGVVCTHAKLDPNSSLAIDEMQARPSLPVHRRVSHGDANPYGSTLGCEDGSRQDQRQRRSG